MSFLEQHSTAHRKSIVIAVAAIHAVGIYAVVTGLGGIVVSKFIDPTLKTWDEPPATVIKVDPPRPKHEDKALQQVQGRTTVEAPPLDLDKGTVIEIGPMTLPSPGPVDLPKPQQPGFTPKAAAPLGNPGAWAGEADYPGSELRAGHQGNTRFRLSIDSAGRVSDCAVIGSSGWPVLDAATCRLVSQRARFRPATDSDGNATGGSFTSTIRWVIPN